MCAYDQCIATLADGECDVEPEKHCRDCHRPLHEDIPATKCIRCDAWWCEKEASHLFAPVMETPRITALTVCPQCFFTFPEYQHPDPFHPYSFERFLGRWRWYCSSLVPLREEELLDPATQEPRTVVLLCKRHAPFNYLDIWPLDLTYCCAGVENAIHTFTGENAFRDAMAVYRQIEEEELAWIEAQE